MGDYLKPRRRKIGMLTLVMACMFMGGWVRSTVNSDYIRFFPVQFHGVLIVSAKQEILLQTWSGAKHEVDERRPRKTPRKTKPEYQPERFGIHLNEELTKRVPIGSSIATVFQPESGQFKRYHQFRARYWHIVVPLTLLSACLLLSDSCQSIPKKTDGPTAIEGAT